MADTMVIIYEHACDPEKCSRVGRRMYVRPKCDDGAVFIVRPHCIDSGASLVEVAREVY